MHSGQNADADCLHRHEHCVGGSSRLWPMFALIRCDYFACAGTRSLCACIRHMQVLHCYCPRQGTGSLAARQCPPPQSSAATPADRDCRAQGFWTWERHSHASSICPLPTTSDHYILPMCSCMKSSLPLKVSPESCAISASSFPASGELFPRNRRSTHTPPSVPALCRGLW